MGNDGGSIAKRRDLARNKTKAKRMDKAQLRHIRVTTCAISGELLTPPIVACRGGVLFNKEALLEAMVQRGKKMREFRDIKGLKDIREVRLTPAQDKGEFRFICPVSGQEMDGYHKFVFNWACGCVVSEKAVLELPGSSCLVCGMAVSEMVSLNESPDSETAQKPRVSNEETATENKGIDVPVKKSKIVNQEALDESHLEKMKTDERKI